ncbi:putative oxidoreductase CipA [Xylariaceae sp. FL0594]|nr:putative oxidoreductase CipA [Xylariaceae sp. FL0594]
MSQSQSNHIKNVAIVGANGHIGKCIVQELLASGSFHVKALTRSASSIPFPPSPSFTVAEISYTTPSTIVSALAGQDILIITLSSRAPLETHLALVTAAADAGVRYVIPNEWGVEYSSSSPTDPDPKKKNTLPEDVFLRDRHDAVIKRIEELGKSSWMYFTTGFWQAHSLALPDAFGFDLQAREVTFFDDGETKINTVTWQHTAKAVTALLSLPTSTLSSSFLNTPIRTSTFLVSQKDIFASVLRVTGTRESDWAIAYVPAEKRYQDARAKLYMAQDDDDRTAYQRLLYSRAFFKSGEGDFESKFGLDDERLGLALPSHQRNNKKDDKDVLEALDEETRYALRLVETGFTY